MNTRDFLHKLEQKLSDTLGKDIRIQEWSTANGGCINAGMRIKLSSCETFFVKWNTHAPPDMFVREAEGLTALKKATSLRIPSPILAAEPDGGTPAFLVLEDLLNPQLTSDSVPSRRSFDEILAEGLAELHSAVGPAYGFEHNNYIGSTPQPNPWTRNWIEFFRVHRLEHLWKLLSQKQKLPDEAHALVRRFLDKLDNVLDKTGIQPVLLHGDLWGGNVMRAGDGMPALIDPACYYGDREADLAMTQLFGGFSHRFYAAYNEAFPLERGYSERACVYNLYHILNHALLFGSGYLAQALSIMKKFAG
ncbi:MAG: fructosamine kinase family protein [Candidatus Sumerlaeaceae bacterium]|nr:fructosamine kinase family protein [Candidatus Sumerlaeaceae bacterium]